MLDRVAAAAALVVLSPILLALAVVVKRGSPGPVIYRRRVMGRGGSQFDALKFRSMYVNGDEILYGYPDLAAALVREEKLPVDPRVTPSGLWMRRLSLDELPQLANVLLGQMSLVGPRIISPPELKHYGPYADELLTVRPALTGPWQISGRADLPYEDRVRLDIDYVRNRTFMGDITLLLMTIPAVLKGKGAY